MPAEYTVKPAHRLTLQSRLDDMALLWPWVESLAAEYAVPPDTVFALHICLEEAISNIIRHGYQNLPDNTITVDCASPHAHGPDAHHLFFTVEDHAPPFDPVTASLIEDAPATSPVDYLRPGGRGILLLRSFAGTLAYQRIERGERGVNRLTIGFVLPQ